MKKSTVGKVGIVALGALMGLAGTRSAHAATTANTQVTLEMQDNAAITTSDAAVTVTPTLSEVVAGSAERTALFNLTVSSTHGADVTFSGSNGTIAGGNILDADLALKADAGIGYQTVASGATLWSSSAAGENANVPIAVKISNLGSYNVGNYTNDITFTVTAN